MITEIDLEQLRKALADELNKRCLAQKRVLTEQEAAELLGIKKEDLEYLAYVHALPYYKVGTRRYYNSRELIYWKERYFEKYKERLGYGVQDFRLEESGRPLAQADRTAAANASL